MSTSNNRVLWTLLALVPLGAGLVQAQNRDFRIHPSIGIARVGDSPEHYLAPDSWDRHFYPSGGYRDAQRRIKRMGVRFRIYEYVNGVPVDEITEADAAITWTVRLVNKKAARARTDSGQPLNPGTGVELRIDTGQQQLGASHPNARREVGGCIGSPPAAAPGTTVHPVGGCVVQDPATGWVKLGDLETNADGQLIVLGGHGVAASWNGSALQSPVLVDNPLDNPGWFDDTADGPVEATITLTDGSVHPVRSARVVVAPPDFARPVENLVTLYDLVRDRSTDGETAVYEVTDPVLRILRSKQLIPVATLQNLATIRGREVTGKDAFLAELEGAIGARQADQFESLILQYAERPASFAWDVYPVLQRVPHLQWTLLQQQAVLFGRTAMHAHGIQGQAAPLRQLLEGAHQMHRSRADFFDPPVFSLLRHDDLSKPGMFLEAQRLRNHVVDRLKDPRPGGYASEGIGEPHSMPPVEGLMLTPTQYQILLRWRDGFFVDDWAQHAGNAPIPLGPPAPGFPVDVAGQPAALDRAAMQGAVGGPLTPGVEVGARMADESTYDVPFHVGDHVEPGDLTQDLTVPWQVGFNHQAHLYPGARPVWVIVQSGQAFAAQPWTRGYTTAQQITKQTLGPEDTTMDISMMDLDTIFQNQRMDDSQDMVDHWMELGFLARRDVGGEVMYIEVDRR